MQRMEILSFEFRATLHSTTNGPFLSLLSFLVAHTCDLLECEFVHGENGSVDGKCSDERDT